MMWSSDRTEVSPLWWESVYEARPGVGASPRGHPAVPEAGVCHHDWGGVHWQLVYRNAAHLLHYSGAPDPPEKNYLTPDASRVEGKKCSC